MEIQYPVIVAEYAVIVARSEFSEIQKTVRQTKLPRRSLEIDAILYSVMVAEYSVIVARQTVRQTKLPRRSLEIDAILYSVMVAEYSGMGARSMKLQRLDLLLKLNWHFLSKSPFVECTPVALKSGASLVAQT
jgi:hypothetical protein